MKIRRYVLVKPEVIHPEFSAFTLFEHVFIQDFGGKPTSLDLNDLAYCGALEQLTALAKSSSLRAQSIFYQPKLFQKHM
ncbi:MAG: hypothetical protein AAGU19_06340 [Prolixibacteraceae bacterium]